MSSQQRIEEVDARGVMRNHTAREIVRAHPHALTDFPEPPKTIHGLPLKCRTALNRLHRHGVIKRIKRCDGGHEDCEQPEDERCDVWVWRFTRPGYVMVMEELANRTVLPCGHAPFSNPRGEDGYGCTNEDCDARYTRAEIEEVMG